MIGPRGKCVTKRVHPLVDRREGVPRFRILRKTYIEALEHQFIQQLFRERMNRQSVSLAGDRRLPMQPADDCERRHCVRGENDNPAAVCADIAGIPLTGLLAELIKIVQAPRLTMILYEVDNVHGQIYTDGRSLPKEFDFPAHLGYSIGHWEGDVFVVDTAGFNDKTSWISWATRTAKPCTLPNAFTAATSGTWM